jgi:dipeptidyl aminopeptidase/acylaminoacyl peptidase
VAALRERGIDHEYLLYPDEGHGFAKPENRLAFYAAAERFLARHLGGRSEE